MSIVIIAEEYILLGVQHKDNMFPILFVTKKKMLHIYIMINYCFYHAFFHYILFLFQGWYIITYALGIYLLNLFIAFLTPQVDPAIMEDEGM